MLPTVRTHRQGEGEAPAKIRQRSHGHPDPACDCPTCRRCSLAYLRHLFVAREAAVLVLATVHNVHFFLALMRRMRSAIIGGCFAALRTELLTGAGRSER